MKELYDRYLYVPKHEKVRDNVIVTRLVITITIVLICLMAMSFSAYAYFTHNVSSQSNMIKAATFNAKVQVELLDTDGAVLKTITPITSDRKNFKIEGLEVGKTYSVTISQIKTETSAKTGFIILKAESTKSNVVYHTQQLGVDTKVKDGITNEIKFNLMITDSTAVYLKAEWGTSSYYNDYQNGNNNELYITQNETIKMVVNGKENSNKSQSNNDKDATNKSNEATSSTTSDEKEGEQNLNSTVSQSTEATSSVNNEAADTVADAEKTEEINPPTNE